MHPRIVNFYGLEINKGLLVTAIEPNSPASRSGLFEGDILIQFNGQDISSSSDLFKKLNKGVINKIVELTLIRRTFKKTAEIVPLEKPM